MMKANVAFTTFAVLVVSPAFGQQSDTSYCSALADKYQRYVGNTAAPRSAAHTHITPAPRYRANHAAHMASVNMRMELSMHHVRTP